jgi:hypothetical protein
VAEGGGGADAAEVWFWRRVRGWRCSDLADLTPEFLEGFEEVLSG